MEQKGLYLYGPFLNTEATQSVLLLGGKEVY